MVKPPATRSSSKEIDHFLQRSRAITRFVDKQPRLLFAVDATASRQPTWNRASKLQQEMFHATDGYLAPALVGIWASAPPKMPRMGARRVNGRSASGSVSIEPYSMTMVASWSGWRRCCSSDR